MAKSICIYGAGGSARETYWIARRCGYHVEALLDIHPGQSYGNTPVLHEDYFDPNKHLAVVAIGNSSLRKKIVENVLQKHGDVFVSIIDPSTFFLSPNIKIGRGAVIAPGCVLTCDIEIGEFCQLNVATSIMHDVQAGDFFTTAPGVRINGKVKIGNVVYVGSNAVTKEEISICDYVTIGAGACAIKDITKSGVYVGIPAHKLEKNNG